MRTDTRVQWNVVGLIGWANLLLALIALTPALAGYVGYNLWGGVVGLLIGGVLVSVGRPLRRDVLRTGLPHRSE